jgi:mono/diheme cytochrome c family protein
MRALWPCRIAGVNGVGPAQACMVASPHGRTGGRASRAACRSVAAHTAARRRGSDTTRNQPEKGEDMTENPGSKAAGRIRFFFTRCSVPALAAGLVTGAAIGVLLAGPWASAAQAQSEDQVKAGLATWRNSGCADCHGAFADGEKQRDEMPTGANLRTTKLDAAALKQTISCGRPGAGMPSFDDGAYKVRACNGQTGEPPGDLFPAPVTLTPDQIGAVVAYLQARVIGKGRTVSKQECLFYYAGEPEWCDDYK